VAVFVSSCRVKKLRQWLRGAYASTTESIAPLAVAPPPQEASQLARILRIRPNDVE
jgi:hypothetical protein